MRHIMLLICFSFVLLACDQDRENKYTAKPYQGDVKTAEASAISAPVAEKSAMPMQQMPVPAEPSAEPAETMKPMEQATDGQAIYTRTCAGCHGSGAAGAPKLGDVAAWAPRIAKGKGALYQSALHGVPGTAMMAKGTCGACSEADLKAAVDYMVSQSQ